MCVLLLKNVMYKSVKEKIRGREAYYVHCCLLLLHCCDGKREEGECYILVLSLPGESSPLFVSIQYLEVYRVVVELTW